MPRRNRVREEKDKLERHNKNKYKTRGGILPGNTHGSRRKPRKKKWEEEEEEEDPYYDTYTEY